MQRTTLNVQRLLNLFIATLILNSCSTTLVDTSMNFEICTVGDSGLVCSLPDDKPAYIKSFKSSVNMVCFGSEDWMNWRNRLIEASQSCD